MTFRPTKPAIFFLDANVLIAAAWKANAEVANIWQLQDVRLVTSILVMEEVQRNLPQVHQVERLRKFMTVVELTPAVEWHVFFPSIPELMQLPEKDRHVLAAASQARADYLITGDKKHFSHWFGMTVAGVRVEPPTNLLSLFRLPDR